MNCCERRELCAGAVLLRFGLGALMLVASIGKFTMPKGAILLQVRPEFYQGLEKMFGNTWLPEFMWRPFAYAIPWAEVALGILLVLGIARFYIAVIGALYMLGLALGMMVAQQIATVAYNYMYFGLFVACVILSRYDCVCVDAIFCRKCRQTQGETNQNL
ncbi:DoxX family protein [bacterium]|nr:DoxX family protein [bacterium]